VKKKPTVPTRPFVIPEEATNDQTLDLQASELPENSTAQQDTGVSTEGQDKAAQDGQGIILEQKNETLKTDSKTTKPESNKPNLPKWVHLLNKYHNDFNGLLAGKENLKIVAVNLDAKPSFYRKWSTEANQVMRVTASLRRRSVTAQKKYQP
jgi:isopenicillin N synthase-like dioxygenase